MSKLLNLIFLLVIIFFYYTFYIYKIKSKSSFFLILFISFSSIITYIMGIFNLLYISKIIISLIGLILFIFSYKDLKRNPKQLIEIDTIIYTIICVLWLFIMTRTAGLSHWDDFSHWYRIAKVLHYDNLFPNTNEILYTTYFPGTACFIYFITCFIPFNVSNCFFAQGLIVFGATSSLLASIKNKNTIYKIALAIIGTLLLCGIYSPFYVLIVDSLIGLVALSIFLLIENNKNKYDSCLLLLLISFLPLIKASGILFSIILTIYYIKNNKNNIIVDIILLTIPLLLLAMYTIRNSIIFPSINTSNQAISLSRFINVGSNKSIELIFDIIKKYLFSLINILQVHQITIIWISLLIMVILHFTNNKNTDYKICIISFATYSFFLLLVYIFSMDISEATGSYLACFDRYVGTLAIFLFGIAYSNFINDKYSLKMLLSTSIVCIFLFDFSFIYKQKVYEYTDKMWFDLKNRYQERNIYNTTNYVLIYDDDDYRNDIVNKARALGETYFRSEYVYAISIKDIENNTLSDEAKSYIKSANETIWLTTNHISLKQIK